MGSGSCKLTDVSVEYTKNGDYSVELPEGYDGFSSVDVKVDVQPKLQHKEVDPQTHTISVGFDRSEYDGLMSVQVNAVTAGIDENIKADNIKKDVTILGITGTMEEGISPTGTKSITSNGIYDVTEFALASVNVQGGGSSVSIFDGVFDEEGLRAIGWDDNDIDYFKEANPHFSEFNADYLVNDASKEVYRLLSNGTEFKAIASETKMAMNFLPKVSGKQYGYSIGAFDDYISLNSYKNIIGIPTLPVYRNIDYCFSKTGLNYIPPLDFSNVMSATSTFEGSPVSYISILNFVKSPIIRYIFRDCGLISIKNFDVSAVSSGFHLFENCTMLSKLPTLDTANMTNMENTFAGCSRLRSVSFTDTSKVTAMKNTFKGCSSLIN